MAHPSAWPKCIFISMVDRLLKSLLQSAPLSSSTFSSSSTSTSTFRDRIRGRSAMAASMAKTVLMVMLLLAAVVATHGHKGHKVSCKNNTPAPINVEGVEIAVGAVVDIYVVADLDIKLFDKAGKVVKGKCHVPVDVTALVFVYVDLSIQVKVAAVSKLLGLLHTVLGLVLTTIKCIL